jgi:hypothetical protein
MRFIVGVVTILSLAMARSALASVSPQLVYTRTPDALACPDDQTLRSAVAARFGYDPFVRQGRELVIVQVSGGKGTYTGRVQLVDEQGLASGTREISSSSDKCSELSNALALAISIALDALMNEPPTPATATESQQPEAQPTPPVPWFAPDARDAAPKPSPKPATPAGLSPWSVGGDLAVSAGYGPSPGPRIAAFARLRPSPRLPLSIALEISADWSLPSTVYPAGSLTSELYSANVAPCWHFGAGLFCALGQLGWMQASTSEMTSPGSDGMLFAAVGARVGAEWPLSDRLFVRFHGDLLYDLERPRFASSTGDATWWNAAVALKPVVGALGLGVGYQIP